MTIQNRRTFLRNGLMMCVGTGGSILTKQATVKAAESGSRWQMIIDLNRCTGCQSCVIACKLQNRTVENHFNTRVVEKETGEYPNSKIGFTPILCNHCEQPRCLPACPEKAIIKLSNGIVLTDWNKCTGHGDCIAACPYHARFADERFGGKADKCDLCLNRLNQGLTPACVEACAAKARIWGDMAAPSGEFKTYLTTHDLRPLRPDLDANASIVYRI